MNTRACLRNKSEFKPKSDKGEVEHSREGEEELFIARGDAAKGFDACEEVFDSVSFLVNVFVKRRFLRPSRVHSYDGDPAELVHISAVGVAVIAHVHESEATWFKMSAEQGWGLMIIGHLCPSKNEAEWGS